MNKKIVTRQQITHKIIAIILLGTILPILIQSYLIVKDEVEVLKGRTEIEIQNAIRLLAFTASEPVWTLSEENLKPMLQSFLENRYVSAAKVFHKDGRLFIEEKNSARAFENTVQFKRDILRETQVIGYLEIKASFDPLLEEEREIIIRHAIHSFVLLCLVLFLLAAALYFIIQRPITLLHADAEVLAKGDFQRPLHWAPSDEIAAVGMVLESLRENTLNLVSKLEKQNQDLSDKVKEQSGQVVQSAKMAALGEMAGGIAHEINNPMHIIHGRAELLQEMIADPAPVDKEKAKAALDRISTMVFRVSKIIKVMRQISRKSDAEPMAKTSLKSVVDDAMDLLLERLKIAGVGFKNEITEDIQVNGIPSALSQVVLNLVGNSKDAVSGKDDAWVKIDLKRVDGKVRLTVIDSGKALDPELAKKIMQPFFTTKEVGKGTGLGLSISKTIMQNHGGDLYFEDREGHTSFVMEFPEMKQS